MPGVDSAASSCAKSETRRRLLTLGTLASTVRFRVLLMRQIDMDHPSRIDFYGQMFQKFPEGTDTIMQKGACIYVKRLLERLLHIETEQAARSQHASSWRLRQTTAEHRPFRALTQMPTRTHRQCSS